MTRRSGPALESGNLDPAEPHESFVVGDWSVEPRALRVRQDGEEHRLEPRVMALLVALARRPGDTLTRRELLDRAWPDVVVGDDALSSAISKLRRSLGDEAVETVPRVGYRLLAPVRRVDAAEPTPAPASPVRLRLPWAAAGAVLVVLVLTWAQRTKPAARAPFVRPLTTYPGLEVEPDLAPGGDRTAFAWKGPPSDGGRSRSWDIHVAVLGDGEVLRLTDHPGMDHYPAWSPDGRHVAFLRFLEGGCEVRLVPALGGASQRVGECAGQAEGLTYAPDGRRLVWTQSPGLGEPFRVVALGLEGGEQAQLTWPPSGSVGDLSPAISPDGRTLAFIRSPVLGVEDVHLRSLAEERARRLTFDGLKIHGLDWSTDGSHVVISSNRGGRFSLWQVTAAGGEPEWLGVSGGDLDAPSVAADRVVFEQWSDETNLYRLTLAEGTRTPILPSTRWDWDPAVAPDGERLAFISDRSGSPELWTGRLDGTGLARRSRFAGPYLAAPAWSPEGHSLAFDARRDGNADIWILDGDVRLPRRLTRADAEDLAPSWSRDGRWIYFASRRDGAWRTWIISAAGGDARPVGVEGSYFARESPDGRRLLFSRRDQRGLWQIPLTTENGHGEVEPECLVADLEPLDARHWDLTKNALYYFRRPAHDRPVLVRRDLATGRSTELAEPGLLPHNTGLSVAPDGSFVLLARIDRLESDLMIYRRNSG